MSQSGDPSAGDGQPVWREEFAIRTADERYVARRQFTKFMVLTSVGMFVGNLSILIKSWLWRRPQYAPQVVAGASELPVGGVKLFTYPTEKDRCILVRLAEDQFVAYSQKCTHLSCAVYFSAEAGRFECPCHEGFFRAADGAVLQGPPQRPLPRIVLEMAGDQLVATGVDLQEEG
jgi:nitrite reductase/ring-hydroxylating ferredoxin subunit